MFEEFNPRGFRPGKALAFGGWGFIEHCWLTEGPGKTGAMIKTLVLRTSSACGFCPLLSTVNNTGTPSPERLIVDREIRQDKGSSAEGGWVGVPVSQGSLEEPALEDGLHFEGKKNSGGWRGDITEPSPI